MKKTLSQYQEYKGFMIYKMKSVITGKTLLIGAPKESIFITSVKEVDLLKELIDEAISKLKGEEE